MPVKSKHFMDSAKALLSIEDCPEINLRNAGSRAYYAVFHAAMDALERKGLGLIKVDKAGSHESVIATLCHISPPAKSIGEALGRIKRFRNDCDYQLHMAMHAKKVAMHIAQAEILIDKLSRI